MPRFAGSVPFGRCQRAGLGHANLGQEGKIQVANTRHDRAGGNSAGPRRGPQPKARARERIAAERAARKRAEARWRILVAVASVTAVLAVALSHFGIWSNLGTTTSSATDVYPDTATLSFRTAHYQSTKLTLRTTELTDNAGHPLQAETPLDNSLIGTFDVPPYVNSADQSGAVPFLDIANRYVLAGAQYAPQVLAGLSAAQIASQLSNPSSPVAQAVDGSARVIIAAIDQVLHEPQP